MRKQQSGIMLLEALIAILVFSLGVLGIVGLQATAVAATRDAKYRTDAGLLANELVGQMMTGNRVGANLQANFQGDDDDSLGTSVLVDGPLYLLWRARVRAALPGADTNDPQVIFDIVGDPGPPQTASVVRITVRWMPPNETVPHSYQVVVQII
ncbi:MAG: type IV pilus modification protein PilV [Propionivibrio sp.]|uniref:type IV pilus modification protein PilV n=1 Tax=Propionivibrio sp. TaxID=2212460 RepID=UPI001A600AAC|nr:type IV pilus modification protein PilV [Propionivibrio sp.]MBL8412808.1 type IV pilus modification protein PilV [Propionivibrio sp.]